MRGHGQTLADLQAKILKSPAKSLGLGSRLAEGGGQFVQNVQQQAGAVVMPVGQVAQRRGAVAYLGRCRGQRVVDIQADAQDVAAVGQQIDQDAGQLTRSDVDIVGPVQADAMRMHLRRHRGHDGHSRGQRPEWRRAGRQIPERRIDEQAERQAPRPGPPAIVAAPDARQSAARPR